MQAIMISIQPQWVEKILNGEKTIEIRKTMPKCELPCKVYIYCTKNERQYFSNVKCCESLLMDSNSLGKVVAEFLLDTIECFTTDYRQNVEQTKRICQQSCVDFTSMSDYEIGSPCLYAWHIDDLVVYDKPKELSEFYSLKKCDSCKKSGYESAACRYDEDCKIPIQITRPPQSWCYVEEYNG